MITKEIAILGLIQLFGLRSIEWLNNINSRESVLFTRRYILNQYTNLNSANMEQLDKLYTILCYLNTLYLSFEEYEPFEINEFCGENN